MKRSSLFTLAVLGMVACEHSTQVEMDTTPPSPLFHETGAQPVGIFTVTNTNDAGPGSLRQALIDANEAQGLDLVRFDISGVGPHVIKPQGIEATPYGLPIVEDPVIIDGFTQPGASPNTNGLDLGSNAVLMIELDGSDIDGGFGLILEGGESTVRGLVINNFDDIGILIQNPGGNVIEGCYIGVEPDGTTAAGNTNAVLVNGVRDNTIGGSTAGARNVISGNRINGVAIINRYASGNVVRGNFVGVDATGTQALGNGNIGVSISNAPTNTIAQNVISANTGGVVLSGSVSQYNYATGNLIQGNIVGADLTGQNPLGNRSWGIMIFRASDNTVGGTQPEGGNIIAFNQLGGVGLLFDVSRIDVSGNSIFSNGGLGIDLGDDGVSANDPGDGDAGPNLLQNFPVLSHAKSGGGLTVVAGLLNSAPGTEFGLEFFSSSGGDPSGHGEGERFIGSRSVITDAAGQAAFTAIFSSVVTAGNVATATATDPDGNTSEFSAVTEVEVLTPQEQIVLLIDAVQELADVGVLKAGQTHGLIAKLNNAIGALDRGKTNVAINKLSDFINQVEGVLSPEQGEYLIAFAQRIVDVIT